MSKEQPKPRYRISFCTNERLNMFTKWGIIGTVKFYKKFNGENLYTHISKLS